MISKSLPLEGIYRDTKCYDALPGEGKGDREAVDEVSGRRINALEQ